MAYAPFVAPASCRLLVAQALLLVLSGTVGTPSGSFSYSRRSHGFRQGAAELVPPVPSAVEGEAEGKAEELTQ